MNKVRNRHSVWSGKNRGHERWKSVCNFGNHFEEHYSMLFITVSL